jgi:serine O-acetyltransferase
MADGPHGDVMDTFPVMTFSLEPAALALYITRQLNNFFPDETVMPEQLARAVSAALGRVRYCFTRIHQKYFVEGNRVHFYHLHTDQYAMFLGYLSNALYQENELALASKAYALNKALHAIDLPYVAGLPDVFCVQHPVGTVLGRAKYSNYFFVYQRCTVGGNIDRIYPRLGEGVVMYGGSALIGNCTVGENCWLAAGTIVKDQDLPPNSVVFGNSPNLTIKPTKRNVVLDLFKGRQS